MVCLSLNIGQSEGSRALHFKGKEVHLMEVSSSQREGTAQQPPVSPLYVKLQTLNLSFLIVFIHKASCPSMSATSQATQKNVHVCEGHPSAVNSLTPIQKLSKTVAKALGREGCSSFTANLL